MTLTSAEIIHDHAQERRVQRGQPGVSPEINNPIAESLFQGGFASRKESEGRWIVLRSGHNPRRRLFTVGAVAAEQLLPTPQE